MWPFIFTKRSLVFLQTLQCLQQNAKERSESSTNVASTTSYTLPSTTTKMSMQELDELRKKLGNVTASSNAPQVSPLPFALSELSWLGCVTTEARQGRGKVGEVEKKTGSGKVDEGTIGEIGLWWWWWGLWRWLSPGLSGRYMTFFQGRGLLSGM